MEPRTALRIAERAHRGQTDRQGQPYITHPIRVAKYAAGYAEFFGLDSDIAQVVGYLHDTIEDTDLTYEELSDARVPAVALDAVLLLTRPADVTYAEFIGLIIESANIYAIIGKLADHDDNEDPARSAGSNPGLAKRYAKSRVRLTAALENLLTTA
jgi:HD superfamily phosphodiesterase